MTSITLPAGAVELRNETPRSQIAMTGWAAIAFGGIFVAVGSFILGAAVLATEGVRSPRWVMAAAGAVFASAGGIVVVSGILDLRRRSAVSRRRAQYPYEPWLWDHAWRAAGIGDDAKRELARAWGFALFLAVFLTPFHWIGFAAPHGPRIFGVFALLFDVVIVYLLARGARIVLMRRRFGAPMLRYKRFPFRPGEAVEVSLEAKGALGSVPRLDATLRCVQERYETRGRGRDRRTEVVCYALWSATQSVDRTATDAFELRFAVPADAPGCAVSERPARYWELELLSGDIPGADFVARFLVPVYPALQPDSRRAVS